jgi:hypothetical protein
MKSRAVWAAGSMASLGIFYLASRYDVLGRWHSMLQWPIFLSVIGAIVIAVAAITFSKKVLVCTPAGYIIGFILAWLFNTDSYNEYDTLANNGWMIWMWSFLIIIFVGIIWTIISKCSNKRRVISLCK